MTDPESIIARAALALHPHLISSKGIALSKADKAALAKAEDMTRAVIMAMRATTPSMREMGAEADANGSSRNAVACYLAMIDAALSED